jgi:hypothetical protein
MVRPRQSDTADTTGVHYAACDRAASFLMFERQFAAGNSLKL